MTVKGIAMGLKLGSINDTDVLSWPRNFVEMQLQTTKQLPATCSFFSCEHTQQVIDETVEHCVGKTAVVTGAASELGLAVSKMLAAEGANVALIDENKDVVDGITDFMVESSFGGTPQMEFAGRNIKSYGGVIARDATSISAAVDAILEDFGKIDILINAAEPHAEPFVLSGATTAAEFIGDINK